MTYQLTMTHRLLLMLTTQFLQKIPSQPSLILHHLPKLHDWYKQWKIRLNCGKSKHSTFTLRRYTFPPINLRNNQIPQTNTVYYLALTFMDMGLTC